MQILSNVISVLEQSGLKRAPLTEKLSEELPHYISQGNTEEEAINFLRANYQSFQQNKHSKKDFKFLTVANGSGTGKTHFYWHISRMLAKEFPNTTKLTFYYDFSDFR